MTDRVLLGALGGGAFGLKVSVPGYSVSSAGPNDLAFDSTKGGFAAVLASGTVSMSSGGGDQTVYYGVTLSYAPLVLFNLVTSGAISSSRWHRYSGGTGVSYPRARTFPRIISYTDRFVVKALDNQGYDYADGDDYTFPDPYTCKYAVVLIKADL